MYDDIVIQEVHFNSFCNLVKEYPNLNHRRGQTSKCDNYPTIMKIFVSSREKQVQPQKLQRNEGAKKKKRTV